VNGNDFDDSTTARRLLVSDGVASAVVLLAVSLADLVRKGALVPLCVIRVSAWKQNRGSTTELTAVDVVTQCSLVIGMPEDVHELAMDDALVRDIAVNKVTLRVCGHTNTANYEVRMRTSEPPKPKFVQVEFPHMVAKYLKWAVPGDHAKLASAPLDVARDWRDLACSNAMLVDFLYFLRSASDLAPPQTLEIAQRLLVAFSNKPAMHLRLRAFMVLLAGSSGQELLRPMREASSIEEWVQKTRAAFALFRYAHALADRLCAAQPMESRWWRLAHHTLLDVVHAHDLTGDLAGLEMGVKACALLVDAGEPLGVGTLDGLTVHLVGLAAKALDMASDGVDEHTPYVAMQETTLAAATLPPTCIMCWTPFSQALDPPVTFGDGESVCRGCTVAKKNRAWYMDWAWGELDVFGDVFGDSADIQLAGLADKSTGPRPAVVHRRHAAVAFAQRDYERALWALDEAIRLEPASASAAAAFANRAAVLVKLEKPAEAVDSAHKAVALSAGRFAGAHYRLFQALAALHVPWIFDDAAAREYRADACAGLAECLASITRASVLGGVDVGQEPIVLLNAIMHSPHRQAVVLAAREVFLSRQLKALCATAGGSGVSLAASASPREPVRRNDVDCTLCYGLLALPVTLPCGHSFCRPCVIRALDHGQSQDEPKCPVCRFDLYAFVDSLRLAASDEHDMVNGDTGLMRDVGLNHLSINRTLDACINAAFPDEYAQRLKEFENEDAAVPDAGLGDKPVMSVGLIVRQNAPVCMPQRPSSMIVWNPADRLLLRRLAFGPGTALPPVAGEVFVRPPAFGVVQSYLSGGDTAGEYGVMCTLEGLREGEDGGLHVQFTCANRFAVQKRSQRDGYTVAEVKLIDLHADKHEGGCTDAAMAQWEREHAATMEADLEEAAAKLWTTDSAELITQGLRRVVQRIAERTNPSLPCCDVSSVYWIADMIDLPQHFQTFLCFSDQLRDSHVDRMRFVLRLARGGLKYVKGVPELDAALATWYAPLLQHQGGLMGRMNFSMRA